MRTMLMAGSAALVLAGCAANQGNVAAASVVRAQAGAEVVANANSTQAGTQIAAPDNILLAEFAGAYDGVPQWDKVTPAAFDEAFAFAIKEQSREIAAITANPAAATFANTIEPYQKAGERLGRVGTYFGLMTSNVTTPEYQALDKVWSPRLSAASDAIRFDPALFARITGCGSISWARRPDSMNGRSRRSPANAASSCGRSTPAIRR